MWAVMAGTFTLRFSTGLTGAMLVFYLARLHDLGGERVDAVLVGVFAALFYIAELGLSPIFGILGDRFGHHRTRRILAVVATRTAMGRTRGVYRAAGRASPSPGSCGVGR